MRGSRERAPAVRILPDRSRSLPRGSQAPPIDWTLMTRKEVNDMRHTIKKAAMALHGHRRTRRRRHGGGPCGHREPVGQGIVLGVGSRRPARRRPRTRRRTTRAPTISDRTQPRGVAPELPGVAPRGVEVVEVGGFEPPSLSDRLGLLRAQPGGRSHLEAPTGRGPRGQPGFDVRRRPPDGTAAVSLLTTPYLRPQAIRRGRLLN